MARITSRFIPSAVLSLTVLLLALILASLGQGSLEREKALLLDLKEREAQTIVRSVASAARIGAMMPGVGNRNLERFVHDAAQTAGVVFIAVYDPDGKLAASSAGYDPATAGLTLAEMEGRLGEREQVFTLEAMPPIGRIYLYLSRFQPLDSTWIHLRMMEMPNVPGVSEPGEEVHRPYYALVAMTTGDIDEAIRQGTRRALLNGFFLLLVGTIGFYFLILVQGYYSARHALTEARQYAIDVIDGMAEGLVNIRHDGILLSVNPEAERLLALRAADVVGRHWSEVLTGDRWRSVGRFLESGSPFYDLEVQDESEGHPRLAASMIPVRGPGGASGAALFLRSMREVDDLKAEVRRSERLAALGRLVAGMAHEVRNPLNSIRGFSQHLQGRFAPGTPERGAVDVIVREVDRLNRVITDLLDFSRPKEPRVGDLDLNDVARATLGLVDREAGSLGITCVQDLQAGALTVRGDADSLKQLLLNLLLNAFQAMPDGGVVTVRTRSEEGRAVLSVADTGVGIAPENQERIFEPFFTLRESGTGLGLAIVHRIAQDHNAEIRVSSEPGRGAAFTVRFPLNRESRPEGSA